MPDKLKILILEDVAEDAEVVKRLLKKEGMLYDFAIAGDKPSYLQVLQNFKPDVILADHTLPQFNSVEALELMQQQLPGTVFILVTGTVSEEFAATIIKKGADDYILKDRLTRLPDAIDAAIKHKQDEKEKKKSLQQLKESEERFKIVEQAVHDGLWDWNLITHEAYLSPRWKEIIGYRDDELPNHDSSFFNLIHPDDKAAVAEAVRQNLEEKVHYAIEFRLQHKDGSYRWVFSRGDAITDTNGQPVRMAGSMMDITEQKKAEELKQQSELRASKVFESNMIGLIYLGVNGNIVDANDFFLNMVGYTKQELLSGEMKWNEMTPTEYAEQDLKAVEQTMLHGSCTPYEKEYIKKDGTRFPILIGGAKIDNHKEVNGVAFVLDITEPKNTEKDLRNAHQRLTNHLHNTPLAIIEWDKNFIIQKWSPWAENIFGWSEAEVVNKHFNELNLVFEEDAGAVVIIAQEMMTTAVDQNSIINRNITKAGKVIYCQWFNSVLKDEKGNVNSILSLIQDITESKKTDLILAGEKTVMEMIATEKSLSNILSTIALNYESYSTNAICSILLLNEEGTHIRHGAGPSLPDAYNKGIDGIPIGPVAGSCGTALYRKERVIVSDIATDPLWVNYRDFALGFGLKACWSTPIINTEGKVYGTFAIYYKECRTPLEEDLTLIDRATNQVKIILKRYYNEALIKASEEKFRTLVEQASDAIFIYDAEGNFLEANSYGCKLSGYTKNELLKRKVYGIIEKEHLKETPLQFEDAKNGLTIINERKFITKDGCIIEVELSSKMLPDGRFLGIARDITERKKAEEEIRNAIERFEFIGKAANDVIWDWDLLTNSVWWNDNYYSLYGYEHSLTLPDITSWTNGLHPDDSKRVSDKIHRTIDSGEKNWFDEYRYLKKDGSIIFIYDRGFVLHDELEKPIRMVGSMQDITERKKAEEKILQLNQELEQRVKDRTTELENANKDLEEINDLFVGREARLIELKQELTALKNKFQL